jgi:hypothetical protein
MRRMRKALLLSILAMLAAPAVAADTGHCDATPFTFGKPPAPAPKVNKQASADATVKKPVAKPQPKPKPTLFTACKSGKTKKPG